MDVQSFVANLTTRGYSPCTVKAYERELEKFQAYLKAKKLRITQISARVIMNHIGTDDMAELTRASVQRKIAALSCFFDYLTQVSDGRIKNPVRIIRRPRKQQPNPKPVEMIEVQQLLQTVDSRRDRAIIHLFLGSGLRLSELASLNRDSIQVETLSQLNGVRILGVGRVVGKGQKEREFLVDSSALEALTAYLQYRGSDANPALFVSNRNTRLSPRTIEHMVRRWSQKAGLKDPVHPHRLRHTAATGLHRAGVDIQMICLLMGHSSISTTQKYIRPSMDRIRIEYHAAMSAFNDGSWGSRRRNAGPDASEV